MEQVSNTPDFILASFLCACLSAFDGSVIARDKWHGHTAVPGATDRSDYLGPDQPVESFERVAVIPWDLIERARQYQDRADKGYEPGSSTIDAILDAADGVTS